MAWPSIEVLVCTHRPLIFTEFNPVAIRNHSRVPPEVYLEALFSHAAEVVALHLDGRRVVCARRRTRWINGARRIVG